MQDMKSGSETIARARAGAFECKTANMREIVKAEGGNNFTTPASSRKRTRKRNENNQVRISLSPSCFVYCVPFGFGLLQVNLDTTEKQHTIFQDGGSIFSKNGRRKR
jgi:hypothetical protein